MILEWEVPESGKANYTIMNDGRYFTVPVPDEAEKGDLVNIFIALDNPDYFAEEEEEQVLTGPGHYYYSDEFSPYYHAPHEVFLPEPDTIEMMIPGWAYSCFFWAQDTLVAAANSNAAQEIKKGMSAAVSSIPAQNIYSHVSAAINSPTVQTVISGVSATVDAGTQPAKELYNKLSTKTDDVLDQLVISGMPALENAKDSASSAVSWMKAKSQEVITSPTAVEVERGAAKSAEAFLKFSQTAVEQVKNTATNAFSWLASRAQEVAHAKELTNSQQVLAVKIVSNLVVENVAKYSTPFLGKVKATAPMFSSSSFLEKPKYLLHAVEVFKPPSKNIVTSAKTVISNTEGPLKVALMLVLLAAAGLVLPQSAFTLLGFTPAGPEAGSLAASWMSYQATANGVGVHAGSIYSFLQSAAMGNQVRLFLTHALSVITLGVSALMFSGYLEPVEFLAPNAGDEPTELQATEYTAEQLATEYTAEQLATEYIAELEEQDSKESHFLRRRS